VTLPFAGSLTSVPIDDDGWSSARAIHATLGLDVSLLGDTVLPFETLDEARDEDPDAVTARRQVSELDATTMIGALHVADLDLDDDDDDDAETLPEEPLPTLTIAQYASLHAELLVHPEWVEAIRQRYHLSDEAMQRRLDAAWQQRFASWPDERADFQHKLAEYQRWLRTQGSRR
jgi:hypothetical protein